MMRKLVKIFVGIAFFTLFGTFSIYKVSAYNFNPGSGSHSPNSTIQIVLTANPPNASQTAVQIRLLASNMVITNFVPISGSGWVGATPDCNGGLFFTATTVCASLAKTTPIVAGETIGTLTVTFTSNPAVLTKQTDNLYADASTSTPDTGSVTYTVTGGGGSSSSSTSTSSVGTLPSTAISDNLIDNRFPLAIIGIFITLLVILSTKLFTILKNNR